MAKVFIGIALLFMLATAGVGFMLKGNVDKLQTSLSKTKGQIADAEGKARAAKNDAEKAQKDAKDAGDKAAAAEKTAADKTKEADDAKMQLAEAKQVLESKEKELAAAKASTNPADPNAPKQADIDALKAQLADATAKEQAAEKDAEANKLAADAAVAKGAENDRQLAELRKKDHERDLGIMRPGLHGRILAVNSGWNFVVLSVGDKNGVLVNSSLVVVRGNEPVARLRVTSVEPSTAIADVLPGTVRKGVTVQPGDTVIFEGTRGNQQTTKPAPDSAPAPAPTLPVAPAPGLPNS
ncbi:hypothetical protein CfE428DRAFT_1695 [Chthoniobacter flavus Ellin428]|uniref:Uncharacterized protein n=1 Tax=Chthoniobacter flavus Ellin428 TaxID=497964 RepID=B4CYF7_9BACT|nr:hypothetical protein [Chthoniobacter flavus]EDY20498.1 hypothetical protein CfE428DRAFT_1695 [Chthoniobacter flavus Ellin428]TCO85560.1 uncharacterized protein DUF3359 [Chthoniobacter flavus]